MAVRSLLRAFLFGLSLSAGAELLQFGFVDRIPSLLDVGSNTCGALVGFLVAKVYLWAGGRHPNSLSIYRPIAAAAAIPIAIAGTLMLVHHRPKSDFSNWNPAFHLAIGNELTGNRPWVGTISYLAIYPFAMSPPQINLARRAAGSHSADEAQFSLP